MTAERADYAPTDEESRPQEGGSDPLPEDQAQYTEPGDDSEPSERVRAFWARIDAGEGRESYLARVDAALPEPRDFADRVLHTLYSAGTLGDFDEWDAKRRPPPAPEQLAAAQQAALEQPSRARAYASAALERSAAELAAMAPNSGRNGMLNISTWRLAQFVQLGLLPEAEVRRTMTAAAFTSGLDAGEIHGTVNSAMSSGLAKTDWEPLALPDRPEWDAASRAADLAFIGATPLPAPGSSPTEQHSGPQDRPGATNGAEPTPEHGWTTRLLSGGAFIHDAPDKVPAVWGIGDDVLWSKGEPLILTGPTGVGKTTLGGQLIAGRLGLLPDTLGLPVVPGERRTLVLAMDRVAQIRRALARLLRRYPRSVLDERLVVWPGPPPMDLARHPGLLLMMAQAADADTIVLDSLKDAAVKLSDEETGQGLSRALNLCVSQGVEVLAYHHQTKHGAGGIGRPRTLADVYGSAWITAGAGSVVLLWGLAGDLVVELEHLKQPASVVGPLTVVHDHLEGTSRVDRDGPDVLSLLRHRPRTVTEVAQVFTGGPAPDRKERERARRRLDRLVRDGLAKVLDEGSRGGADGREETRYGALAMPE